MYLGCRPKLEETYVGVIGDVNRPIAGADQFMQLMGAVGEADLTEEAANAMMRDAGCTPDGTMTFAQWAKLMMDGDGSEPQQQEKKFFGLF